ncbi:MAG: trigger factor [Clostridiales bacterium]|nr:trigger factor [Clostridiales bacterium]
MLRKVENKGKNVVQLEIEVDAAIFNEGLRKSFQKNANKFNIPGFRKGKAPQNIVEKFYGEQALYEDAINIICPDAYDAAIAEQGINPVDRPEIDIIEIGKNKNLVFSATVTVMPEVELGQYKGVEIKKAVAEVTDEELQKELEKNAEKNSRLITVEDRPVQNGDTAVIDFEGFIDGVAFEGGSAEGHNLVIGSGTFIPGFEEQLIGVAQGASVDVTVNFPDDYGKEDLAGKPALFKVKVNEIKLKEIPALDDEFAKDVSEFDTLAEYKEDIRKKLVERAEHNAEHQNEESVIEKVVANATVEIPEVMVSKRVDELVYDFAMRLQYQGLDIQKYMEIMGMDIDTFKGQFTKRAEQEVRVQIVLEKIAKEEKITIGEDEANAEFTKLAEGYNMERSEFIKQLRAEDISNIESSLKVKKAVEFLVSNAVMS